MTEEAAAEDSVYGKLGRDDWRMRSAAETKQINKTGCESSIQGKTRGRVVWNTEEAAAEDRACSKLVRIFKGMEGAADTSTDYKDRHLSRQY